MKRLAAALCFSLLMAAGFVAVACLPLSAAEVPQATPSGCNPNERASTGPTPVGQSPFPEDAQPPAAYVVGRTDTIQITVVPDLSPLESQKCSKSYTVGVDGIINFCFLGPVKIEGMTERQVEADLRKRFIDQKIYDDPQVTAQVTQFRSQTVYVNGAVGRPGELELQGDQMSLLRAINQAGGFTAESGDEVIILRPRATAGAVPNAVAIDDPTAEKFQFSRKQLTDTFEDPPVRNGDTIWVRKAENFFINGEIKAGGTKIWQPCLTLGEAIAMSNGLTEKASLRRSYIQRRNARGTFDRINNLKEEMIIEPRDQITIRPKLF